MTDVDFDVAYDRAIKHIAAGNTFTRIQVDTSSVDRDEAKAWVAKKMA